MMAAHLASLTPIVKSKPLTKDKELAAIHARNVTSHSNKNRNAYHVVFVSSISVLNALNISPALLSTLKEDTTQNIKWTCNDCKQNFSCMTGLSQQLKTNSRISKMERNMEDINTDIGFRVKNEVASLKTGLVDEVKRK
jgi:hypothetical protein